MVYVLKKFINVINPILFLVASTALGAGIVNLSGAFLAQNMSDSFREDQLMQGALSLLLFAGSAGLLYFRKKKLTTFPQKLSAEGHAAALCIEGNEECRKRQNADIGFALSKRSFKRAGLILGSILVAIMMWNLNFEANGKSVSVPSFSINCHADESLYQYPIDLHWRDQKLQAHIAFDVARPTEREFGSAIYSEYFPAGYNGSAWPTIHFKFLTLEHQSITSFVTIEFMQADTFYFRTASFDENEKLILATSDQYRSCTAYGLR